MTCRAPRSAASAVAAAILLLGVLGLTACSLPVAPVVVTTQAPPVAAVFAQAPPSAIAAEPAERFWLRFNDDDLAALVAEALRANLDIRLAVTRLTEARALSRVADGSDLPNVGTSATAGRQRNEGRSSNTLGAALEASWEIDLLGRRSDEQRAARADAQSSAYLMQAAQLAVAGDVARHYFELRGLQERLRVAVASLATQREALKLVQARLEVGRGTALDTERALALVSTTEASVPALELQGELTRQRLAVLLGQAPQALAARLAPVKPLPGLQAVMLAEIGTPENLLRRRPDLQAAEQQAVAAAARVGQTHKARLPRLTLRGALGLNAGRLADFGNSASFVYNLGAGLAWTLFDGGANQARVDAASARNEGAVAAYDRAVLLALEETEAALATYTHTQRQADSLFNAARAADKAADIARARFTAGVSDFLTVLDAERERLASRDRLAQAQTGVAVAVVSVYRALAGGVVSGPP